MTAAQQAHEAAPWRWDELMYVEAGQGRALPPWALWLIGLGDWLASCPPCGGVVRVVVSVPTRRYAGVLAAVGIVAGAARKSASRDPVKHLARLAALPRNTPVRYREGNSNKVSSGRLDGVVPERGEEYVRLIGGYRRVARQCTYIEPLPLGCDPFTRGREICEHPDFVEVLTGQDAALHAFPQQVECTIVGTKAIIQEEFGLALRLGHLDAALQDLARPAAMQSAAGGYRSRIVSANGDPKAEGLGDPAGAIVLDGPSAVLRWRHVARARPWLAVLDRTSSSAVPASAALLAERASRIADLSPPVSEAPPGIEMLCYIEAEP